jgi:hypothetical protein
MVPLNIRPKLTETVYLPFILLFFFCTALPLFEAVRNVQLPSDQGRARQKYYRNSVLAVSYVRNFLNNQCTHSGTNDNEFICYTVSVGRGWESLSQPSPPWPQRNSIQYWYVKY